MAQYKVPQDVEADDKLIGPFSFRQFIYLLCTAALCGIAYLLFRIFYPLIIIPIPFIFFFLALALPLKKDQPMETYLAAIVSFYTKPRTRFWQPGQGESTVIITAHQQSNPIQTKGLSQAEATRRLSFLANIVDTEGYAIKNDYVPTPSQNSLTNDFYQDTSDIPDMFDLAERHSNITETLAHDANSRHEELIRKMQAAIEDVNNLDTRNATIQHNFVTTNDLNVPAPAPAIQPIVTQSAMRQASVVPPSPNINGSAPATPISRAKLPEPGSLINNSATSQTHDESIIFDEKSISDSDVIVQPLPNIESAVEPEETLDAELADLATNSDFSIETIAKQAQRIKEKKNTNNGEVYISLH